MYRMALPTIDLRPRNQEQERVGTQEPIPYDTTTESLEEREIAPTSRETRIVSFGTWEAPEHVVYEKTILWYIVFGVVVALTIFTAFLLRSFLAGIVFFLGGLIVYMYSERPPRIVKYELLVKGIGIGDRLYPYSALTNFNIVERAHGAYVLLRGRRLLMPLIHIPLADSIYPDDVKEVLLKFLPEDPDLVEPLPEIIAHWLGF